MRSSEKSGAPERPMLQVHVELPSSDDAPVRGCFEAAPDCSMWSWDIPALHDGIRLTTALFARALRHLHAEVARGLPDTEPAIVNTRVEFGPAGPDGAGAVWVLHVIGVAGFIVTVPGELDEDAAMAAFSTWMQHMMRSAQRVAAYHDSQPPEGMEWANKAKGAVD